MKNEVVGIAVLDRERGNLHIACDYGDMIHVSSIQAVPVGQPAKREGPCWHYKELPDGETLEVTPSVRILTTIPEGDKNVEKELFHNGGLWRVKFADYDHPWELCRLINRKFP